MGQFNTGGARRPIQGQAVSITGPGLSSATSEAVGRMGQVIQGQALDAIQTERLQLEHQQRERQRLFDAAEAQKESLAIDQAKSDMAAAHDEIGSQLKAGQLPKDQAEKQLLERTAKISGTTLEGVRPQSQELARRYLEKGALTLGTSMRRMVDDQARHEIGAGMLTQLETLQREYRTDPAKTTATAMGLIEQQGPLSNFTPEQRAKMAQGWKEGVQFTTAFEAVSAARTDRKALSEAEKMIGTLPDLDPQKRAQLMDRAQAYRLHLDQQDELRAQRAQREAERRLKQAEAEFNTFQTLADKGTVLAPEYIDRATRATAGTPYQAGIVALARQAVETGGFAAQPVGVQRATLQALDAEIATKGRTPELDKRREKLAKVLAGSEQDLGADALNAGLERGVIARIEPLNLSAGVAGLAQQLGNRSVQAGMVETWAGRPVSPLTRQEADGLGGLLRSMPPEQKATALQTLAATMSPGQAQALAGQLDGQDKALSLALGYGAARTTFDRPVAELILRGQEAIKAKSIKLDDAAETGLTANFEKEIGGAISNPEQAQRVREAARLIWAGKAAEGQRIDAANAVRIAVGGQIVEHNGAKVVLPAGLDESALRQRLQSFTPDAFAGQLPDGKAYVRGQPVDAAQFVASLPGAQLRTLGRGRFAVVSGGAIVTNARMQPVVVEVGNAR